MTYFPPEKVILKVNRDWHSSSLDVSLFQVGTYVTSLRLQSWTYQKVYSRVGRHTIYTSIDYHNVNIFL